MAVCGQILPTSLDLADEKGGDGHQVSDKTLALRTGRGEKDVAIFVAVLARSVMMAG